MWKVYLSKIIDYFGGVTDWYSHGYQRVDEQYHERYYYFTLFISGVMLFAWILDGSISSFLLFFVTLPFSVWGWHLKNKRPMVDALFPTARGGGSGGERLSVYASYDSATDKSIDDIPYNRSIGEVLSVGNDDDQ